MRIISTSIIKQIVLLILIAFIGIVLLYHLKYFIPGMLGAITLYILLRRYYFRLTVKYKWKNFAAASLLIIICLLAIGLPTWILVEMIAPKLEMAIAKQDIYLQQIKNAIMKIQTEFPFINVKEQDIDNMAAKLPEYVPEIINAVMSVAVNTFIALFIFYFMLLAGKSIERKTQEMLPLKKQNISSLWAETRNMVVSNAIGLPILLIAQSIIASVGYWIFGIEQYIFWGIITGVASLLPVVGTLVIWVPLVIFLYAAGDKGAALGLGLYSAIITANIDNVLRFTILKKIGNVHPLITVFGVIVGMKLFGLMGLIFGPLLMTYFILLLKIYRLEFAASASIVSTDVSDIPRVEDYLDQRNPD